MDPQASEVADADAEAAEVDQPQPPAGVATAQDIQGLLQAPGLESLLTRPKTRVPYMRNRSFIRRTKILDLELKETLLNKMQASREVLFNL